MKTQIHKIQEIPTWGRRTGFCLLLLFGGLFLHSGFMNPPKENAPERFKLLGHSYEGDLLFIQYYVPYPGMTKVNLYDPAYSCLWKGQYVDDIKGEHQIILRAASLRQGISYMLEFDYKNQLSYLPVSAP